ncbi:fungal-specific transcription factor domain-containing protein [Pseudomassariella vexata]|uniref:Fungal-specific transcription factor domain-domain-containing protein n=1 Tax=Pseudomassariella vexata TaxID=1141098 RepID=A0A1Y2E7Q0_9PEZI|nr:fungal-specific transcription factor domain-containing protein [Pseudomassariella vexata]ORY67603.1 fungal-specific transcription factor domain-domain-containing protein [Pseudomassariella vexata]
MDLSQTDVKPGPDSPAGPIKRRAPIACRRCRRMRSKCLHENGKQPPCKSCLESGVPEECVFPSRGDSDHDRLFRHPRQRSDKKPRSETSRVKRESVSSPGIHDALVHVKPPAAVLEDEWDLLPEVDIVKEGVEAFFLHFFQLGFIHKQRFPKQLEQNPSSVSVFLLLSILSISARFNKTFETRYGSGQRAVQLFTERAEELAVKELYLTPTLERCQAFFLLSIAELGNGKTNASYINMGVATRMAVLMRLHREETYERLTPNSSPEEIVRAESARRTLWMLHSQDNLHSGPYSPVALATSDITALLPSDEDDFKYARLPRSRAALEGTPPADRDPSLVNPPKKSLFASLMQVHHLWGIVARRAVAHEKSSSPGDVNSDYAKMARRLREFEDKLPSEHTFGKKLWKGYRHDNEDLAYIGCTACTRLCNIVLRKAYLDECVQECLQWTSSDLVYRIMAGELFENVRQLYEQVDAQFNDDRTAEERVGSQMAAFCVYSCGLLATYLCKFPQRGHDDVQIRGKKMYQRTVEILEETKTIWPLASSWLKGLRKWFEQDPNANGAPFQGATMDHGVRSPVSAKIYSRATYSD